MSALNTDRKGDWMQTYTGRAFWPLDPRPEEIDIDDIAHALSMQCRYAGHCLRFYSVAEHSVWCALMALMPNTDFVFCKNLSAAVHAAKMLFSGFEPLRDERLALMLLALLALMHDAPETYLVDLVRPVKRFMPAYAQAELQIERAIAKRFGLCFPMPAKVKEIDERMLATEAQTIMAAPPRDWNLTAEPYHLRSDLLGNDPSTACGAFREMFRLLAAAANAATPEPTP